MICSSRRGPWLPEEDQTLMDLVRTQGPNNWVRISQQIQHRSPKQCRERYHQNLKPTLNHEPLTAQEGEMIEQMVQDMGKRWAEIARRLGNRSDNAVKNWWNGSMNRRRRNPVQSNGLKQIGHRLPIPALRADQTSYRHHPGMPGYSPRQVQQISNLIWATPDTEYFSQHRIQKSNTHRHSTPHSRSSSNIGSNILYPTNHTNFTEGSKHQNPDSPYPEHRDNIVIHARAELPSLTIAFPPASQLGWPSSRYTSSDRPLISPAASDVSYSNSYRQPPSLTSDNQSTYSISPKTVTSPRPKFPHHIEIGPHLRIDHTITQRLAPALRTPTDLPPYHSDECYMSAMPSSATDTKFTYSPLNPALQRTHPQQPLSPISSHMEPSTRQFISARDTRMHVSSLIE